jgi:hypothetical protein
VLIPIYFVFTYFYSSFLWYTSKSLKKVNISIDLGHAGEGVFLGLTVNLFIAIIFSALIIIKNKN